LQTLTENPISDLPVIKNNPTVLQQKEVRLGGIIVSTNNEATRTKIEILIFPLTPDGRPLLHHKSQGRPIAYILGFLDPMNMRKAVY
jgi:starvation-inducible outer membrane lipoprotein